MSGANRLFAAQFKQSDQQQHHHLNQNSSQNSDQDRLEEHLVDEQQFHQEHQKQLRQNQSILDRILAVDSLLAGSDKRDLTGSTTTTAKQHLTSFAVPAAQFTNNKMAKFAPQSAISPRSRRGSSHWRIFLSIGLLLPALAAIIGIVAWTISVEVASGTTSGQSGNSSPQQQALLGRSSRHTNSQQQQNHHHNHHQQQQQQHLKSNQNSNNYIQQRHNQNSNNNNNNNKPLASYLQQLHNSRNNNNNNNNDINGQSGTQGASLSSASVVEAAGSGMASQIRSSALGNNLIISQSPANTTTTSTSTTTTTTTTTTTGAPSVEGGQTADKEVGANTRLANQPQVQPVAQPSPTPTSSTSTTTKSPPAEMDDFEADEPVPEASMSVKERQRRRRRLLSAANLSGPSEMQPTSSSSREQVSLEEEEADEGELEMEQPGVALRKKRPTNGGRSRSRARQTELEEPLDEEQLSRSQNQKEHLNQRHQVANKKSIRSQESTGKRREMDNGRWTSSSSPGAATAAAPVSSSSSSSSLSASKKGVKESPKQQQLSAAGHSWRNRMLNGRIQAGGSRGTRWSQQTTSDGSSFDERERSRYQLVANLDEQQRVEVSPDEQEDQEEQLSDKLEATTTVEPQTTTTTTTTPPPTTTTTITTTTTTPSPTTVVSVEEMSQPDSEDKSEEQPNYPTGNGLKPKSGEEDELPAAEEEQLSFEAIASAISSSMEAERGVSEVAIAPKEEANQQRAQMTARFAKTAGEHVAEVIDHIVTRQRGVAHPIARGPQIVVVAPVGGDDPNLKARSLVKDSVEDVKESLATSSEKTKKPAEQLAASKKQRSSLEVKKSSTNQTTVAGSGFGKRRLGARLLGPAGNGPETSSSKPIKFSERVQVIEDDDSSDLLVAQTQPEGRQVIQSKPEESVVPEKIVQQPEASATNNKDEQDSEELETLFSPMAELMHLSPLDKSPISATDGLDAAGSGSIHVASRPSEPRHRSPRHDPALQGPGMILERYNSVPNSVMRSAHAPMTSMNMPRDVVVESTSGQNQQTTLQVEPRIYSAEKLIRDHVLKSRSKPNLRYSNAPLPVAPTPRIPIAQQQQQQPVKAVQEQIVSSSNGISSPSSPSSSSPSPSPSSTTSTQGVSTTISTSTSEATTSTTPTPVIQSPKSEPKQQPETKKQSRPEQRPQSQNVNNNNNRQQQPFYAPSIQSVSVPVLSGSGSRPFHHNHNHNHHHHHQQQQQQQQQQLEQPIGGRRGQNSFQMETAMSQQEPRYFPLPVQQHQQQPQAFVQPQLPRFADQEFNVPAHLAESVISQIQAAPAALIDGQPHLLNANRALPVVNQPPPSHAHPQQSQLSYVLDPSQLSPQQMQQYLSFYQQQQQQQYQLQQQHYQQQPQIASDRNSVEPVAAQSAKTALPAVEVANEVGGSISSSGSGSKALSLVHHPMAQAALRHLFSSFGQQAQEQQAMADAEAARSALPAAAALQGPLAAGSSGRIVARAAGEQPAPSSGEPIKSTDINGVTQQRSLPIGASAPISGSDPSQQYQLLPGPNMVPGQDQEVQESAYAPSYHQMGGGGGYHQPAAYSPGVGYHEDNTQKSKGITFHFGGGPIGGGTQLITSPMGIFKHLMIPLLPNPRVNLNGKLVFGVVLEKTTAFGEPKKKKYKLWG